jgi:hypothetical protein
MKNAITGIRNNIYSLKPEDRKAFDEEALGIHGSDYGCHSAGGEYFKNNSWYNAFEGLPSKISKEYFKNTVEVSVIGNQTYGYGTKTRDVTTEGRVKLSSSLPGAKKDVFGGTPSAGEPGRIITQLSSCPIEGDWCLSTKEPPAGSVLSSLAELISGKPPVERYNISEPILCGNIEVKPERFFCATYVDAGKYYNPNGDHTGYNGKWRKDW